MFFSVGALFPCLRFFRVIVGGDERLYGDRVEDLVVDWKIGAFWFLLRFLHDIDELGNGFCLGVEVHNRALNFDGVGLVEAAAVLFEMFEELYGSDCCVEGLIILEFFVPRLVDDGANEVDAFSVRGDVEVAAVAESLVDRFFFANLGGGVPGDRIVI